MKSRFNSLDTLAVVTELQKILRYRVLQIYDIDNKTYLIKLNTSDSDSNKTVLLFESGFRIHTTKCDWPKNPSPSGFTMKLRKHIRNKRIIKIEQLGCDRIIRIQFGVDQAAYHLFIELFNRGNIVLTDYELTIVSLLRSFTEGDLYHFAAHEKYPVDRAKQRKQINLDGLKNILSSCKKSEQIVKVLLPHVDFGLGFLEHSLRKAGIKPDTKVDSKTFENYSEEIIELEKQLSYADQIHGEFMSSGPKGYILCCKKYNEQGEEFIQMLEFNPYGFVHGAELNLNVFDSFTDAVDEYFSNLESQKLALNLMEKEKEAMKKVNKIRNDQQSRLSELSLKQTQNKIKADLIMNNAMLVESALQVIRSAIAAQMSWGSIKDLIYERTRLKDPVLSLISKTKFEINQISLTLSDPFAESDEENTPTEVDIDLGLSAHANAERYYDDKKHAAIKEKKTLESQKKAMKSAEKKAKEILKTTLTQVAITVSRKIYWFEKFYWFISSDNHLVIGGRDQKQNEIIVKKYMKVGDIYVHADLIGASSVVIKNPSGAPVPPRTLDEAGLMAVCYSNAWETKILCGAWWVYEHQVSKTAPSGEYLVTGSFMIRGQKNFLLPATLQLGFSFLFKIDESSAFRHVDERKAKIVDDELNTIPSEHTMHNDIDTIYEEIEQEVDVEEDSTIEPVNDESPEPLDEIITNENIMQESADDEAKENIDTMQLLHTQSDKNISDACQSDNENDDDDDDDQENEESESSTGNLCDEWGIVSGDTKGRFTSKKTQLQSQISDQTSTDGSKDLQGHQGKLKRGQKSRQKKIKEKYKNQDEEEKLLRMSILQSAGAPKTSDKKGRKKGDKKTQQKNESKNSVSTESSRRPLSQKIVNVGSSEFVEDEIEIPTEVDMLSLLTGQPHVEDEILYAIPIVAPYSALINNKYKMKLAPGTSKRGKAARTILETFTRSKDCTLREKDCMKTVNDQLLSRNLPGKVKLLSVQHKKK